jgi:hypothetical protein
MTGTAQKRGARAMSGMQHTQGRDVHGGHDLMSCLGLRGLNRQTEQAR